VKNETGIFCGNIPFSAKNGQIENPPPHLDVDFNLVAFLRPVFKLLRHD
jgi:hypothetical protein